MPKEMIGEFGDASNLVGRLNKIEVPASLPAACGLIDLLIRQVSQPAADADPINTLSQTVGQLAATVVEIVDVLGKQAK
ncbi:hypothetical protein [Mycobacteroides abscessus]|uniref:hypothetical protein n=1 Tax=Mycobacteroides abscessus TaxID=36809 RepID=UPI0002D546EC|nr:hypothetical protein [Mycobacteroides abscessus]